MTKKIKKLMKDHRVTGRQIARKLHVTETWVSLVLHRKGKSMRVLEYIAKRTGTTVEDFIPKRKAA